MAACLFGADSAVVREGGPATAVADCHHFFDAALAGRESPTGLRLPPVTLPPPSAALNRTSSPVLRPALSPHPPDSMAGSARRERRERTRGLLAAATHNGGCGRSLQVAPTSVKSLPRLTPAPMLRRPPATCSVDPPPAEPENDQSFDADGFDSLLVTLRQVVQTLSKDRTLGQVWDTVSRGLLNFADAPDAKRLSQNLTALLMRSGVSTDCVSTTTRRCPWVCASLSQLLGFLARAQPDLTSLCEIVLDAVNHMLFSKPPPRQTLAGGSGSADPPVPLMLHRSTESERLLVAPFRGRAPFFEVSRILHVRLHGQGGELANIVSQREKQLLAMDKVAEWWRKMHLGACFRSWRDVRRRDRVMHEHTAAKVHLAEMHRRLARREQESATALRKLQLQIIRSENELKAAKEAMGEVLDLRVRLKQEKVAAEKLAAGLSDRVAAAVADAVRQREEVEGKLDHLGQLMEAMLWRLDPDEETESRAQADAVRQLQHDSGLPPHAVLLKWAQRMISRNTQALLATSTTVPTIPDFVRGGEHAVRALWALLSAVFPSSVTIEELRKEFTDSDGYASAARLVKRCGAVGVVTGVRPEDIADGSVVAEGRLALTAALFRRWIVTPPCGPFALPSRMLPSQDAPIRTHWSAADSSTAFDELVAKAESAFSESTLRRHALAADMLRETERQMIRVLRAGEGAALSVDEEEDLQSFDLPRGAAEFLDAQGDGVREQVSFAMRDHYRKLRRIFYHYATLDRKLAVDDLWRMLSDARIPGESCSRRAIMDVCEEADEDRDSAEPRLAPGGWIGALARIAVIRYPDGPVPQRVERLLTDNIVRHCSGSEANEFRALVYQPSVQIVVGAHRPLLKKIFRHYAVNGWKINPAGRTAMGTLRGRVEEETPADLRRGSRNLSGWSGSPTSPASPRKSGKWFKGVQELDKEDFLLLVAEARIRDNVCTVQVVDDMLAHFGAGAQLMYHQFVEMICGLAVYKYPAPHQPLSRKVDEFVKVWLVGKLQDKVKL
eukprot:TRINITY_DN14837_c0_g1_i1.p1 TRINITY_DN14837_c0_g1~~TRINITY_DN14837_c0_g1_i1.p1  ORF type:complete len:1187 (+),score=344.91 TRINITY_DN14837_c0_g1_i1:529-3561(+)